MNDEADLSDCILLLSGPIAVGKSSVANLLIANEGFFRISSGAFLQSKANDLGLAQTRANLQALGDRLDQETNFKWVVDEVVQRALKANPAQKHWLVDAVRKKDQVKYFRAIYGHTVKHVFLSADESTLKQRFRERLVTDNSYLEEVSYEKAVLHPNENASRQLKDIADLVVNVEGKSVEKVVEELKSYLTG